jgi:hypothetical protein
MVLGFCLILLSGFNPSSVRYIFVSIKVDGEKVFESIKNHRGTVFMVKRLSDVSTEKRHTTRTRTTNYIQYLLIVVYKKNSVVDRHRFDADPDPKFHVDADPDQDRIDINMMPIFMRILLPQVSHKSENPIFFLHFKSQLCQFTIFIFLISVKDVIILSILDSILKFCGKRYGLSTFSYAWH